MDDNDLAYYKKRAATERALAAASENKDVAAIHEELARQYEALAERADLRPTLRIVVPTDHSAGVRTGVLHEKSAAARLGSRDAFGGARPPKDSNQPF